MPSSVSDSDRLISAPDLPIKLPTFEGPLDLLLFLIRRNEIDIYDIPIATVADQYSAILRNMETANLDAAGEFFVMASTLMLIKSRLLLPARNDEDSADSAEEHGVDPRWELVEQLIQYRAVKEAAESLNEQILRTQAYALRINQSDDTSPQIAPLQNSDRLEIWHLFNTALRRLSERMQVGEIQDETTTVADRMEFILEKLKSQPHFLFSELFGEKVTIVYLISTFIAMLELIRLGKLEIEQAEPFSDIYCQRVDDSSILPLFTNHEAEPTQ